MVVSSNAKPFIGLLSSSASRGTTQPWQGTVAPFHRWSSDGSERSRNPCQGLKASEFNTNPVLSGTRVCELGLWDDSAGTGDFCQTSQPKFGFWDLQNGRGEPTPEFLNRTTQLCGFLFNVLESQFGLVTISNSEVRVRIRLGIVLIEDALVIQRSGWEAGCVLQAFLHMPSMHPRGHCHLQLRSC